MKMIPLESRLLDLLKDRYRSHSEAARQLGITPRQYRKLRSIGTATERTIKQIQMLLGETNSGEEEKTIDQAVNG